MEKIVVYYTVEKDGDSWNVIKKTAHPSRYGSWSLADEKPTVLATGMPQWNAEYAAAALEYLSHKAKAENKDAVFDVDSLDCLKENVIDINELSYKYVLDTLGSGWGIHNGYKLTGATLMNMWVKGAACRFGFLPLDTDRDTLFETLSSAVSKVLDCYGMRD